MRSVILTDKAVEQISELCKDSCHFFVCPNEYRNFVIQYSMLEESVKDAVINVIREDHMEESEVQEIINEDFLHVHNFAPKQQISSDKLYRDDISYDLVAKAIEEKVGVLVRRNLSTAVFTTEQVIIDIAEKNFYEFLQDDDDQWYWQSHSTTERSELSWSDPMSAYQNFFDTFSEEIEELNNFKALKQK